MLHLELNQLVANQQHGFVTGKACVTNLLETADYRTFYFEKKLPVDTIYLDFSKAFDKVPHRHLLTKLAAYGISPTLVAWIESYLTNRRQRVVLGEAVSDWKPATSGVPQGSVLGPMLFIIYVNDLPSIVRSECKLYADDCKILGVVSSKEEAARIQKDLDNISEWASIWGSFLNEEKCVVMHQGPENQEAEYFLNGKALATSSREKDLGIVVTDDLSLSEQVKKAVATANSMLYRIKNSISYFDPHMVDILYKTFIRPHLEFGVAAWNPYLQADIKMLERVQRRASKLPHCLRNQPYE